MCGRYTYFPGEFSDLRLTWNVDEVFGLTPRYNIAPTQEAPVIVQAEGKRIIELFRWGLIPWWAKYPTIGNRMINARAETLTTERPISSPYAYERLKRHCLLVLMPSVRLLFRYLVQVQVTIEPARPEQLLSGLQLCLKQH